MLTTLKIENFAIISSCELSFDTGFSIFSGETGAGKSIIIDAISLLLGQSATENMIQSGKDQAIIEGTFQLEKIPDPFLDYVDPGDPLIIWRKLSKKKENTIKLNGHTITQKLLKTGMSQVLNIIGQHEHMHLVDGNKQLGLLDQADPKALFAPKKAYQDAYAHFSQIQNQLNQLSNDVSDQQAKLDFLKFQIDDIASYNFTPNEEDTLLTQKKQLQTQEKSTQHLSEALVNLEKLNSHAATAEKHLLPLLEIHPELSEMHNRLIQLQTQVQDDQTQLLDQLQLLNQNNEMDIDSLESRLDAIFKLKTKYKQASLELLLEFYNKLQNDYEALQTQDLTRDHLEKDFSNALQVVLDCGKTLHNTRKKVAEKIGLQVTDCLKKLHFLDPFFEIGIENTEQPTSSGLDKIDFLIRPNSGEPLNPMAKIASGGELSRIMLAIKTVFLHANPVPTLIFDEIDTGIGGITANTVGDFLHQISKYNQVLCITHLPQIARLADHHYVVSKSVENNRTETQVLRLKSEETKEEIARMIGGDAVIETIKK